MLSEREWVGAATAKTGATGPNTIEATFQNHSESLWYVVAIRISRITTEWHPHGFRIGNQRRPENCSPQLSFCVPRRCGPTGNLEMEAYFSGVSSW